MNENLFSIATSVSNFAKAITVFIRAFAGESAKARANERVKVYLHAKRMQPRLREARMFARELGAARRLTEEVPQHPANARKINTAREVRLRVRLSAT